MNDSIPISFGPPPGAAEPEDLRTLVEIDLRRGSIGLHVASDVIRAARTSSSLWLDPDRAEALATELLCAVRAWRDDQAATAWASTKHAGGRA